MDNQFILRDKAFGKDSLSSLPEVIDFTLKMAYEEGLKVSKNERWEEFLHENDDGVAFSFLSNTADQAIFVVCSEILDNFGFELHKVITGDFTERAVNFAAIPTSKQDNDKVLYLLPVEEEVSRMEVYQDGTLVGVYGSILVGKLDAYAHLDENDEPCSEDNEFRSLRVTESKDMIKHLAFIEETGINSLFLNDDPWLELYFADAEGGDLAEDSEIIDEECDFVHGQLSEGMWISEDLCPEFLKG